MEKVHQWFDDFIGSLASKGNLWVSLDSKASNSMRSFDFSFGGGLFAQMKAQLKSSFTDNSAAKIFKLCKSKDSSELV